MSTTFLQEEFAGQINLRLVKDNHPPLQLNLFDGEKESKILS